ncbi:heavy metal sensor histidine kinase [Pseudomonas sp. DC3200b2]|uniref:heavy metal sensor histidine kinase n=1 Tax=Pseudomonas sp. DC3200b2 TaxID=2804669 RepID=UPI003CF63769
MPPTKPGRRTSIAWRAALAFAVVAAGVLSAAGVYLYGSLEAELAYRDDLALMGRLEQVRALLQDADSLGALQQRPTLYQNMLGNQDSLLLVGRGAADDLIAINPHADQLPAVDTLPASPMGEMPTRGQVRAWRPEGKPGLLLLAGQARGRNGEALQVTVGKRLAERDAMLASYRLRLYATVAAGALSAFLLGLVLLHRALKPVRDIAMRVAQIGPRTLGQRLSLGPVPRELHEPVQALNSMLERLDDSFARLTGFSADLAHEMRTPLHTLLTSTGQMLSQPRGAEEYRELLASNIEEFERLNRMVANLLFLARADHGQCLLQRERIDLARLGDELCDYFEALAQDRNLNLTHSLDGPLWADPALVQRALANVLANAVRHASEGSTITIQGQRGADAVTLTVRNHGRTLPADVVPRLFERFYRVDEPRADPSDSGGLGLAIVQSIMHLHDGRASLESEAGITAVSLRFPLVTPA